MDKTVMLFEDWLSTVQSWVAHSSGKLRGTLDGATCTEGESYSVLRSALDSEEQVHAFESVIIELCLNVVTSMLYTLDGNTPLADEFFVQLVDAETKEDLRPKEGTYVSEFSYYADANRDRLIP